MSVIDNLEAMLARGQDNALLRYSLGAEHLKLRQYPQAIEHLQKAVAHDPRYSAAYKLLGEAHAATGHKDEAINTYEQGIVVAEKKGDIQAAKEMRVFLRRLGKATG